MVYSKPLLIKPTVHDGQFSISIPEGLREINTISVSDIHGKKVSTQFTYSTGEIFGEMLNVAPGIYFVQLQSSGTIYAGKMVVQ
jgi:hypothetical protein